MSIQPRNLVSGLSALALVTIGLTGCSGASADVKACEQFDKSLDVLFDQGGDMIPTILESATETSEEAKDPAVSEAIIGFADSTLTLLSAEEPTQADMLSAAAEALNLKEACAAVDATTPNLQAMIVDWGVQDMTAGELDQLLEYALLDQQKEEAESEDDSDLDLSDDDAGEELPGLDYDYEAMEQELEQDPDLTYDWMECFEGDMDACDSLYEKAPDGSELKRFGAECGGFKVDAGGKGCS